MPVKIFCSFALLLFCNGAMAQNHSDNVISDTAVLGKWNRAIINIAAIESFGRQDSIIRSQFGHTLNYRQMDSAMEKLHSGPKKFYLGTAVFIEYHNLHYILTSRHVIEDLNSTYNRTIFQDIFLLENYAGRDNDYSHIRIDAGSNVSMNQYSEITHLMDLDRNSYCMTDTAQDLGIICLEKGGWSGKGFLATLIKRGYDAIKIKNIDTVGLLKEGEGIFTLGYPRDIFEAGKPQKPQEYSRWEMPYKTIAVLSIGTIFSSLPTNPYFEVSMWMDHGNSGGAVVKNNKLIGIVHGWDPGMITLSGQNLQLIGEWIPRISKLSGIMPLLRGFEK